MNNKKITISLIIITVFSIISGIIINNNIYNDYRNNIVQHNSYIINEIIKSHPELEEELINITIKSLTEDNILKKYGISANSIKYLNDDNTFKKNVIMSNLYIIIATILLFLIVIIINKIINRKKIKQLEQYTESIINNNYNIDIRDYDENSFSHLKDNIYKATIKLKEASINSLKDKKLLEETLEDMSHQLKTPLTSMYVINELLEKDLNKAKKKELLSRNYDQINRIEWLVTSLLKISMLDSGTVKFNYKKVNINELVEKSIDPVRIQIELKNITIKKDIPNNLYAKLDLNWTAEALLNIIKNAYEHTEKGYILITGRDNPIYIELTIEDTGSGIDPVDINHIFERFYRSKNNSKESIGIGLNMSKKIIDSESGDVTVTSKVGEGTKFTIRFYKN